MPVKLKIASNANRPATLGSNLLRAALVLGLVCVLGFAGIFGYLYFKYQKVVDQRLAAGPLFANAAQIYAAPKEVRTGQKLSASSIAQDLAAAGYNSNPELGTYRLSGDRITIKPGPQSYHSTDGATITTGADDDGTPEVTAITAENGAALAAYELEPQLITALSTGKSRSKRRVIPYNEIPPRVVQAVTAIEDRRFFEHGGVNYMRLAKCAVTDLVTAHKG